MSDEPEELVNFNLNPTKRVDVVRKSIIYNECPDPFQLTAFQFTVLSDAHVSMIECINTVTSDGVVECSVTDLVSSSVLICGPSTEHYVVSESVFQSSYDVCGEAPVRTAKSRSSCRSAFQYLGPPVSFKSPWNAIMRANDGDVIMCEGLRSYYRIGFAEFVKTYDFDKSDFNPPHVCQLQGVEPSPVSSIVRKPQFQTLESGIACSMDVWPR